MHLRVCRWRTDGVGLCSCLTLSTSFTSLQPDDTTVYPHVALAFLPSPSTQLWGVREFAQEPWDTSCICEKEEEEEGDAWREGGEKEWEGEGEEKVSER